ncbi:MAG: hypothetical protein AB7O04_12965 [Hyphomonadaceae bacterium]
MDRAEQLCEIGSLQDRLASAAAKLAQEAATLAAAAQILDTTEGERK